MTGSAERGSGGAEPLSSSADSDAPDGHSSPTVSSAGTRARALCDVLTVSPCADSPLAPRPWGQRTALGCGVGSNKSPAAQVTETGPH